MGVACSTDHSQDGPDEQDELNRDWSDSVSYDLVTRKSPTRQVSPTKRSPKNSGNNKSSSKKSAISGAADWVKRMTHVTALFGSDGIEEDLAAESTVATVDDFVKQSRYIARRSQSAYDEDSLPPGDESAGQNTATTEMFCLKRSLLVRDMLQFLAFDNPDDINNVYFFAKEILAKDTGTGISRKATVKLTGAVRAVKFVPRTLDPEILADLQDSVAVSSTFDHPNLASLHEIFADTDYLYLVMTFAPGGTLSMRLKQGRISEVKAVIVMKQVFRGVFYMHRNKVIHRDLKPSNILFNSQQEINSSSLIKVSSFGSACRKMKGLECYGVGAPGYRAPELAMDGYGYGVDVWAMGCLIFQSISGRTPFPENTPLDKQTQITYLSSDENISAAARDLISLLLVPDPKARYTIKQSLNHKWLEKGTSKLAKVALEAETCEQLRVYRTLSPFQSAALRIIASRLSDPETMNCRKLFLALDKDGDGHIIPSELAEAINDDPKLKAAYPDVSQIFGLPQEKEERPRPFTYTEFVAATFDRKECLTEAACRAAFRCFDKDGDGYISYTEFAEGTLLGDVDEASLSHAFKATDKNADKKIDFKEFMAALSTHGQVHTLASLKEEIAAVEATLEHLRQQFAILSGETKK